MTRRRLAVLLGPLLAWACGLPTLTPHLHPTDSVPTAGSPRARLKVHMTSGELYVLSRWTVRPDTLEGSGARYSVGRDSTSSGAVQLALDSIALLETDTPGTAFPFGAQALAVMTTVFGTITAICVADPKSCFGSCPTFYIEGDTLEIPRAEGFSSSIARALEARDVDALSGVPAKGSRFAVEMRNEALETHAVRQVRLLVAPRPAGGRVFAAADGRFYPSGPVLEPGSCRGPEGDCRRAVRDMDGVERWSAADSTDLATREIIELEFPSASGRLGVVIGARNTLLTTFLFYQSLAYMGSRAGEYLALLERTGPAFAGQALAMATLLGGIDVEVQEPGGTWRSLGSFREAGPIAVDQVAFPFFAPSGQTSVRIRLRMAKGSWRLDHVGLAPLGEPVFPVTLEPTMVSRAAGVDTGAGAALRDPERYLVTYPGDRYRIEFALPHADSAPELFLESRGYYYEWMRAEWLAEEDPAMVALILGNPAESLRRLARPYKDREASMERIFWHSRFGR